MAGLSERHKRELQGGIKSVLHGTANIEYSWFVEGIAESFEVCSFVSLELVRGQKRRPKNVKTSR